MEKTIHRPKIFVSRPVAQEALDLLSQHTEITVWPGAMPPSRQLFLESVREIEGLFSLITETVDKEVMDAAPKLRVISNMATGTDNIDVEEATRRGIPVGRTPGILAETCADFAFALILNIARRITEAHQLVRAGEWLTWGPSILLGSDIHESTLGIIGMGQIGMGVAKRATGFDMNVLYYSRSRKIEIESEFNAQFTSNLDYLLRESDFVTLHIPFSPETYHFIGQKQLDTMKRSAFLINTSRGPIVDQESLYKALSSDSIRGAAIDVTEVEPIPMDDPLLTLDNLVITPHIASASVATRTRMAMMAADNLLRGLSGEPLKHSANPNVSYPDR